MKHNLLQKIIVLSAVLLLATISRPILAEDPMSGDEMSEVFDDLGNGTPPAESTTTASVPPPADSFSSQPFNDVSDKAGDFDDDNDADGAVDKEMSENSGGGDGYYGGGSTPEPESSYRGGSTPIPTGDQFNRDYSAKTVKKKVKKKKIAKHKAKKHKKKHKIAKSKSKKKSKDRRVAGRKGSSKKRYR